MVRRQKEIACTMTPQLQRTADQMERSGYLPALRSIAQNCCAPFWWHGNDQADNYRILHNGTVCFIRPESTTIAVTADHVFDQYRLDIEQDPTIECQFGGATVTPMKDVIERSRELDLTTLAVSPIQLAQIRVSPFAPVAWPTGRVTTDDVLLYGGFPGAIRAEGQETADISFQWFVGSPISITPGYIKFRIDFDQFHQPLAKQEDINRVLGGISGGPVMKFVSGPLIERLELVGFITESQADLGLVFARPAQCIRVNGHLDHDAAA